MKPFAALLLVLLATSAFAQPSPRIELKPLAYRVVHDQRTFLRPVDDEMCSLWTSDPAKAGELLSALKLEIDPPALKAGEVLAAFLNDTITESITGIVFNETANETFADYADSGIRFKLMAPPDGKKYSHLTLVVFTPSQTPSNLGIRTMKQGTLSKRVAGTP